MADITKLIDDGKAAHQQKKYDEAIQIFDRALQVRMKNDSIDVDVISILDLRVGTHVKMGNLDLACEAAKAMVRRDRADGRGYLRSGQIERLKENYSAAFKWYEHGLKHVPSSDRLHAYIQTQQAKTEELALKQLTLTKATDPFLILPAEILQMVVLCLEYRQVVDLLRVSKGWTRTLTRLQPLSNTLDFRDAHKALTYNMLRASLRRLAKWPKKVMASKLSEPAANLLRSHLERWFNVSTLQHLEIYASCATLCYLPFHKYALKTLVFGPDCTIDLIHMRNILAMCRNLEVAKFMVLKSSQKTHSMVAGWQTFPECPKLRVLHLEGKHDLFIHAIPPSSFLPADVFLHFPNLSELTCRKVQIGEGADGEQLQLSSLNGLRTIDLSEAVVPYLILPRSLNAWKSNKTFITCFPVQPPHHPALINLRIVELEHCRLGNILLSHMFPTDSNAVITHLAIELTEEVCRLLVFSDVLRNLEYLRASCQDLKDEHLQMFLDHMPLLKTLDLKFAAITGVFFNGLLTAPSCCLHRVVLRDCLRISPDAVERARKRGVQVEVYNSAAATQSGRRLRDVY